MKKRGRAHGFLQNLSMRSKKTLLEEKKMKISDQNRI
jgi:hypothetical protein